MVNAAIPAERKEMEKRKLQEKGSPHKKCRILQAGTGCTNGNRGLAVTL